MLLDSNGHVTDTASANFLLVERGRIVSPSRENVLEGVSLKVVVELSARLGIPFEYRDITLDECYNAEEVLLTNTAYCLAHVVQINRHSFPGPGPLFRRLLAAWNDEVGIDIHRQIIDG